MCFDLRSNSTGCHVQGMWWHQVREHDVSLAQATGIHSINSCVIFGEHCRGSTVAAELLSGSQWHLWH